MTYVDALRALLSSLKLLEGMRGGGGRSPSLALLGVAAGSPRAGAAIDALLRLQPGLRVSAFASATDLHARGRVERLDAALVLQPHVALRGRDELPLIRDALVAEEGTLGLLWTRAAEEGLVAAFVKGAAGGGAPAPSLSPLSWVDELDPARAGFKPFKHRKLLETLPLAWEGGEEGDAQLLEELPLYLDDARARTDRAAAQAGYRAAIEACVRHRGTAVLGPLGGNAFAVTHHVFATALLAPPKAVKAGK